MRTRCGNGRSHKNKLQIPTGKSRTRRCCSRECRTRRKSVGTATRAVRRPLLRPLTINSTSERTGWWPSTYATRRATGSGMLRGTARPSARREPGRLRNSRRQRPRDRLLAFHRRGLFRDTAIVKFHLGPEDDSRYRFGAAEETGVFVLDRNFWLNASRRTTSWK